MQQQLYHKSLFAVKSSGSHGSKYNLLCLLWVIRSPICRINTSRASQTFLFSLAGVCPSPRGAPRHGSHTEDGVTKDRYGLFSETCRTRIPWWVGLPTGPLSEGRGPGLVTSRPAMGGLLQKDSGCCEVTQGINSCPSPQTEGPQNRDKAGILVLPPSPGHFLCSLLNFKINPSLPTVERAWLTSRHRLRLASVPSVCPPLATWGLLGDRHQGRGARQCQGWDTPG